MPKQFSRLQSIRGRNASRNPARFRGRPEGGTGLRFGDQELIGRDAETGVMMEAAPSAALVIKPDLLLQFEIVALDPPAGSLVRSTRRSNVMSPPAWQASSDPARPRRPANRRPAADQLADGVQYSPGLALCPASTCGDGAAKRANSPPEWLLIVDRDTGPDAGDHRAGGLAALAGRSRGDVQALLQPAAEDTLRF